MALDFDGDMTALILNTDEHAATITYTPAGGVAASITAVVADQGAVQDFDAMGEDGLRTAQMLVRASDVPAAAIGDSVTYDGDTWQIVAVSTDAAATVLTAGTRAERRRYHAGHRLT